MGKYNLTVGVDYLNTFIESQSQTTNQKKIKIRAIDCDVHPVIQGGLNPLYPYMSSSWAERFKMEGRDISPNHRSRFPHPRGAVNRLDAAPAEGVVAGSNPDYVTHIMII